MNTNIDNLSESETTDKDALVSHVLVYDVSDKVLDKIKDFCVNNSLIGLRAHDSNMQSILDSHIHLGAVFLCEEPDESGVTGIDIATILHKQRPELPIFIRRTTAKDLNDLSKEVQHIFTGAYHNDTFDTLRELVKSYLFSLHYPEELVSGIKEFSLETLQSSLKIWKYFVILPIS